MKFTFSQCVAIYSPDKNKALSFYKDIMNLEPAETGSTETELGSGPGRLFLDEGSLQGPILEFIVKDVEAAREHLVANGCEVVRWEGAGGDCYIKDPIGITFNLWQE
jgi:catechol 2,3-dioxygenase-like lactoylglutathione lyase family enzyme